ncbi:MAG TPA: 3-isopropylmalate dehydratase small subunit [Phototrophicaceae bacterium]|jgi:3-isopropylmalate/(R)-2-methylmalate dehydratase small subunit|nr:3-isopropylmalate dehydratase small subunit [Phototrophicaceae bacterium]
MAQYQGFAHVYGDNIDTDRIIPGKYTKTLDISELAKHALEDLDPQFVQRVKPGDILVAGDNFGSGSSREQAPIAIKAAGIAVVVARSFARIFYRNAINIGLPVVEIAADDHQTTSGDTVLVDLIAGQFINQSSGYNTNITRMPPALQAILDAGGLVNYLKQYGDYPAEMF